MIEKYDFEQIEKKWQTRWEDDKIFHLSDFSEKKKFYGLVEFPYPSGAGLHVGHPRPYTAMDVIARKRRMQGYDVLFPIGWDAFGLPTENYAIANKIHPAIVTRDNVARFKSQIKALGISFDWSREINTTDPSYYMFTQWIFLQMFKKGLAYKKETSVNYCTSCKVVLANEEVVNGVCERCGGEVIHRVKNQWMLAITKYAQRLIDDLDEVDYIDKVKKQQINWIGRSEGAEIEFQTTCGETLNVFTTRPDTLFGATYMVISPEHEYVTLWKDRIINYPEVEQYCIEAAKKSDFERTETNKEKTGIRLEGIEAINPATQTEIPIYISDYVLLNYGTGAIMAVPGHDERDYDFAKTFSLPIVEVVSGGDISLEAYIDCDTGIMVNSGFLNGMTVEVAQSAMINWLSEHNLGQAKVNYKLRDWVFSRQRFWGEPIPIVECEHCGYVPIPEDQLPLILPEVSDFQPGSDGESPLARLSDWVNTTCPVCGREAKRETDTMPQWAGSSWYYLRYTDPHNPNEIASKEALQRFMPVDWYNGGMEHTTLHLLYSRFWHKFLYDIGVVYEKEPYLKRTSHGMILGEDGQKMSKSRGNVVNPDKVVAQYGADTMRMYEMFIGDFEKTATWSNKSIKGCKRFLDRTYKMITMVTIYEEVSEEMEVQFHRTIKKVSEDIEQMKFNTAIAALMTLLNVIYDRKTLTKGEMSIFVRLLSVFAPHLAEELWEMLRFEGYIAFAEWPIYDETKCKLNSQEIGVQVNGRLRGTITVYDDTTSEQALELALAISPVIADIGDKEIKKQIYLPGKILNIVV
ncbi:MAG: leucine--tRNA ligase [Oscillospiraceae bacterium]|nr:leucine--tRNA ligase [Oscillospiraceae bacterium]